VEKPELNSIINNKAPFPSLGNERGVALILVLVMLLLLTILGFTVLTTSTSELRIVGNNRSMETAFFNAESAVNYAYTNGDIYNFLNPGTHDSWPDPDHGVNGTSSVDNHYNEVTIGGNKAMVKVNYVETGPVPAGMGTEVDAGISSGGGFKANYYSVSVKGSGPNNSQAEIDSYVARIVPK
jgi:hypothetical protein